VRKGLNDVAATPIFYTPAEFSASRLRPGRSIILLVASNAGLRRCSSQEATVAKAKEDGAAGPVAQADTIRITLKLFALLSGYLPDGASRNQVELSVPAGSTPASIISSLHLPVQMCALVVVNGIFVRVADRSTQRLVVGDVLAIWPPVAGG
jgi:sulfur-carrier protein